jgi:hemoglobin-like flavoprotein
MSFGSAEIVLVRASFAQVKPIAGQAAAIFYEQLFKLDPELRLLFRGDMQAQGHKLMMMLGAAIGMLEKPQQLLPALRSLGARHAGYGVQDAHYAMVGTALIRTLEQGLGPAFTPATRAAWLAVYDLVQRTMRSAAAAPQEEALAA